MGHGGRRSIAGIKESFKGNAARARLARGLRNKKISTEISCKKFKTHLQFYVKISNKNFSSFFKGKSLYNFSKKLLLRPFFKKFSKISPTSPKFNTHKKVVVHFFIPMLLIPKTPPSTYPNMKRFKGPKTDHFHFTHFTNSLTS